MIDDEAYVIDELANRALRTILTTRLLVQRARAELDRAHWFAVRSRRRGHERGGATSGTVARLRHRRRRFALTPGRRARCTPPLRWSRHRACSSMPQRIAVKPASPRKTDAGTGASVHHRHEHGRPEADAWSDDTAPAVRLVATWKSAVVRAERQLLRLAGAIVLLDVVTMLSGCFVPIMETVLGIARLGALAIFVPAVLRALAIRHADRPDAELLKAIAIALGVAALYLVVRTAVVVEVCKL